MQSKRIFKMILKSLNVSQKTYMRSKNKYLDYTAVPLAHLLKIYFIRSTIVIPGVRANASKILIKKKMRV